ncbi:MAG: 4-(cytidine 5'-diphospho)-2-C-methyl-D-erythritol kinase [Candidatus Binatia bacterium]
MFRVMRAPSSPITSTCDSPAKVNLCLCIVGRRADGYHLLDSIFAAIDLIDRVTITIANVSSQRGTSVAVHCAVPGVPTDATNLVARAATALLDDCGIGADLTIGIDKRIPPGSGLGGGSSNAATVLRALVHMLDLRVTPPRLGELALSLGADVPFFLTGGCARVRGVGEQVDPIPGWPGRGLVVALPPIAVSTAWAFSRYSAGFSTDPSEPERLACAPEPTAPLLRNDLETVVLPAYPALGDLKRSFLEAGAPAAVMSGSGAAVIGLVPPGTTSEDFAQALQARHPSTRFHGTRIRPASQGTMVDRPRSYA